MSSKNKNYAVNSIRLKNDEIYFKSRTFSSSKHFFLPLSLPSLMIGVFYSTSIHR